MVKTKQKISENNSKMQKQPIRVLQIVAVPAKVSKLQIGINGPERRTLSLLPYWRDTNIVPIVLYPKRGRLLRRFEASGELVIDFEVTNKFQVNKIWTLITIINQNKIQVIHTQGPASLDLIAALASLFSKAHFVITRPVMIDDMYARQSIRARLYRLVDKITLRIADIVVAVSDRGNKQLKETYGVKNEKTVTVKNGTNLGRFLSIVREYNHSKEVTIGMVAQLTDQKRWFDFVEVIQLVSMQGLSVNALVVGDGQLMKQLIEYVEEKSLSSKIKFCGFCEDIAPLLQQMDVFLLTSSWEGLPMAVIEAMASGLPIIATDVGGLRELVFDGRNGKLCSVGDVKSLAAACIQLIQNPRLRERQGNESRMIASEQFSEQRMLKEYGDIYKRCGDGGKMQKP